MNHFFSYWTIRNRHHLKAFARYIHCLERNKYRYASILINILHNNRFLECLCESILHHSRGSFPVNFLLKFLINQRVGLKSTVLLFFWVNIPVHTEVECKGWITSLFDSFFSDGDKDM